MADSSTVSTDELPAHLRLLVENALEVDRLVEIHGKVGGKGRGRRAGLEVLNKSAIVLLVACWEVYVEELAKQSFDLLLREAPDANVFPAKVLALVALELKKKEDERAIWSLAGDGWKAVLKQHSEHVRRRHIGRFHTPDTKQVDGLFEALLGLKGLSNGWSWQGMSAPTAASKLDELITLRHEIAHQVKTTKPVHKVTPAQYSHFVMRLAGVCSNQVGAFLQQRIAKEPWITVKYLARRRIAS